MPYFARRDGLLWACRIGNKSYRLANHQHTNADGHQSDITFMSIRITLPLRLDRQLHSRLKELAQHEQRSLNSFIALQLARCVGASDKFSRIPQLRPPLPPRVRKARPNEACPCGSGTKYKRCHGVGSRELA
jgi:hypothetical protein